MRKQNNYMYIHALVKTVCSPDKVHEKINEFAINSHNLSMHWSSIIQCTGLKTEETAIKQIASCINCESKLIYVRFKRNFDTS